MFYRYRYHGAISRETATRLLTADGDFLVRQSSGGDEKKLVLTGMQNGIAKHLLLIDDNGKVCYNHLSYYLSIFIGSNKRS